VHIFCADFKKALKNYCGGCLLCCAVLTSSANFKGYASSLRAVRLVSSLPHNVFQKPFNSTSLLFPADFWTVVSANAIVNSMSMANQKRIKQALMAGVLLVSIAIAATIAFRQMQLSPPEPSLRSSSPDVDMTMVTASFSEMRGDAKLWDLTAEQADYDKDTGEIFLQQLLTNIYDDKAGKLQITARNGFYDEKKRLISMTGDVQVVTEKGMTLTTEQLDYLPDQDLIKTDKPVHLKDNRLTITAIGMELFPGTEQVKFHHQINSVIEVKNARK